MHVWIQHAKTFGLDCSLILNMNLLMCIYISPSEFPLRQCPAAYSCNRKM